MNKAVFVSCALFCVVSLSPVFTLATDEPDELVPGNSAIIKAGRLAKFIAKPSSGSFDLPDAANDPAAEGATLRLFDTVPHANSDFAFALPAGVRWKGLGNPPGSKGYKYKGTGLLGDPCRLVLVRENIVKAFCKGPELDFALPFQGSLGVVLTVGTDSKRYCALYGGTAKGDPTTVFKRKDAPPPGVCPEEVATPTDTPTPEPTATPTFTPLTVCPVAAGAYTLTQTTQGLLKYSTFAPDNVIPPGSTLLLDVGPASIPDCVHDVVVPYPGGFSASVICQEPGTLFTIRIDQIGCGVGRIDSGGGSDFTLVTGGDTSDTFGGCSLPHPGCTNGADASQHQDLTVGNAASDVCTSGTANVVVSVPAMATFWQDEEFECPDADGVFDGGDFLIDSYPITLDFTTDVATATWSDLDGDGCSLAGTGPASLSRTGACYDIGTQEMALAFAGTVASAGFPLYDITLSGRVPFDVGVPAAPLGATCPSPPPIDFAGSATRCIP